LSERPASVLEVLEGVDSVFVWDVPVVDEVRAGEPVPGGEVDGGLVVELPDVDEDVGLIRVIVKKEEQLTVKSLPPDPPQLSCLSL